MTKEQIIKTLSDFPDDTIVQVWCGFDCRDPAGNYNIKSIKYNEVIKSVHIELEDD